MKRRDFLKLAGAVSLAGCAGTASSKARVVVIGGGYGGATAAKYIRMWDPSIEVVMVERENIFTSCPISNLVLGGYRSMDDIRRGYDGLRRHGVQIVNDEATAVDAAKKVVRLQRGSELLQAGKAAFEGTGPRRQSGRDVQGAAVQARVGRSLQGHRRVPPRTEDRRHR